jgi:hypothetical protein
MNSGSRNVIAGALAASMFTSGTENTILGNNAAPSNFSDSYNTYLGASADSMDGISNGTAIGHRAYVGQSNAVILGGITDVNGGTDTKVGIGTTTPKRTLDVAKGDIYVSTAGKGILLKSPDGNTCKLVTLDNSGNLVTSSAVTCP